jgi:hypothetical protein
MFSFQKNDIIQNIYPLLHLQLKLGVRKMDELELDFSVEFRSTTCQLYDMHHNFSTQQPLPMAGYTALCFMHGKFSQNSSEYMRGLGCPRCYAEMCGLEKPPFIIDTLPHLEKSWHPTKNKNLTIYNTYTNYSIRIWWICPKDHPYLAKLISQTIFGSKICPECIRIVSMKKCIKKLKKITKNYSFVYDIFTL